MKQPHWIEELYKREALHDEIRKFPIQDRSNELYSTYDLDLMKAVEGMDCEEFLKKPIDEQLR